MNCNKVSNLLSAFMDGELLGHEHRLIHQHLQQCSDCRIEYDELLQMKRLLAAMRLREPGQRSAAAIARRVSQAEFEEASVGLGDWRLSIPALRSRPAVYSPMIGIGVGLTFFGMMFWAHPTGSPASARTGQGELQFQAADTARDEPPPRIGELTNGLLREGVTQPASFEPSYPDNLPDFPLGAGRQRQFRRLMFSPSAFR